MKARVKSTGEIVEVRGIYTPTIRAFGMEEIESFDMEAIEIITDPDYWTRLEHQYAGMAMQRLVYLVNADCEYVYEETAIIAMKFAHALAEKYKKEESK